MNTENSYFKSLEVNIVRPRRSHSAAAYSDQTFPWAICRSVRRSVQSIVEKTADRIRMPFGIIGRTGPGMRQVVGFGDRSTRRVLSGANLGRAIVTNGDFTDTCATRRGPLPKLLSANVLLLIPQFL